MPIKIKFFSLLIIFAILISCKNTELKQSRLPTAGTIKIEILYPSGEGKTFDMDYYENKHMPMVAGFIGSNLKFYEIDKGISGRSANDKPPYVAIGYFYVKDLAEYNKTIGQHRDEVIGDFKNYTNIQPVVQISEIRQVK